MHKTGWMIVRQANRQVFSLMLLLFSDLNIELGPPTCQDDSTTKLYSLPKAII